MGSSEMTAGPGGHHLPRGADPVGLGDNIFFCCAGILNCLLVTPRLAPWPKSLVPTLHRSLASFIR
jgi:hypothetical protein